MREEILNFYKILKTSRIKALSDDFNALYKEILELSIFNIMNFDNLPMELITYNRGLENDLKKIKKYTFTPIDIYTILISDFTQSKYSKKHFFEYLSFSGENFKNFINVEENVIEIFELALKRLTANDKNPPFKEDFVMNIPDLTELALVTNKMQKLLEIDESMELLLFNDFNYFKKYWSLYYLYEGKHKKAYTLLLNKYFKENLNTAKLMRKSENMQLDIYITLKDYIYSKYPNLNISGDNSMPCSNLINHNNIIIYYYSALKAFEEYGEKYGEDGWLLFFKILKQIDVLLKDRFDEAVDNNFPLKKIYFNADDFLEKYSSNMPIEWSVELYLNI